MYYSNSTNTSMNLAHLLPSETLFIEPKSSWIPLFSTLRKTALRFDCESSASFRCANDYCIHQRFDCDGINNCGDFTDEIGCDKMGK
ncbi:hypothetical protein TNCV_1656771 [Trichonephila clavipes]|nr:hypothetical protein TNCV_1656771 [Trichonephila clavipes]